MCGISLIISKNNNNIIPNIIASIELLQNRGYDSVGIAYKHDNNYKIIKYASTDKIDSIYKLSNTINSNNITSNTCLAHTRWATHGSRTDVNSHPHISFHKNIILVHNGIINNYKQLKNELSENGYKFVSETDTEVIANLIEYYYLQDDNIQNSIKLALNRLQGTWALIIINNKEPDNIYITRHGSPMVLGYNDDMYIATSESTGFAGYLYDYINLDNDDIFMINKYKYTSICNTNKHYVENKLEFKQDNVLPNNYKHWMKKEIYEQIESTKRAYNNGGRIKDNIITLGGLDKIKKYIAPDKIQNIILFGCGTSYNACMVAKYYFQENYNINIIICNACEFVEEDIPQITKRKNIAIFCSQSGETMDLIKAINICRNKKCINIGVINVVDSYIAKLVDCGVYINAGPEISVASTKSFTSMLIVLSLISMYNNIENFTNNYKINTLNFLPNLIENMLYNNDFIHKINDISSYIIDRDFNNIFILGKHKLYPIAHEASLKIKEVCYIHAEGFSSNSLKHGPFALLDEKSLTILLIDYNNIDNYNNLLSTYNEIISRKTNIIIITNKLDIEKDIDVQNNFVLKLNKLDYYNEIIFIIALQYLSYNISIKKNINPDKPRNLAKVVTVE
tara:strand:+ start:992 stop:2863 length:1872 start_codon:yes stop_codon:yes gene_type:complete